METKYECKKIAPGVYEINRDELYQMVKDIRKKLLNNEGDAFSDRVEVLLGEEALYVKTNWSYGTLLEYIQSNYLSYRFAFIEEPNLTLGFNLVLLSKKWNKSRRIAVDLPFDFKKDLNIIKTKIVSVVDDHFFAQPGVIKEYNL